VITNTRGKLNEAKYFLKRMKESYSQIDVFGYNLRAFLSAARSVTFIMQKEFDKVSGFSIWYACKQTEMKANPVMNYLYEQRNQTLHVRPIQPKAKITVNATATVNSSFTICLVGTGEAIQTVGIESMSSKTLGGNVETNIAYSFIDFPGKDVLTICQEDVSELEKIVDECESKFGSLLYTEK